MESVRSKYRLNDRQSGTSTDGGAEGANAAPETLRRIYGKLNSSPLHVSELSELLQMEETETALCLTELELLGLAEQISRDCYVRTS